MKKLILFSIIISLIYACSEPSKKVNLSSTKVERTENKKESVVKTDLANNQSAKNNERQTEKIIENKPQALQKTTPYKFSEKPTLKATDTKLVQDKQFNENTNTNVKPVRVEEIANEKPVETKNEIEPSQVKPKIDERLRSFVKKENNIEGGWSLKQEGDKVYIVFNTAFKTKKGPDLKVFISNQKMEAINSKNALIGSKLVGTLQSNQGEQRYLIPSGVDLSKYKSVIIHCEKYAILWGGGTL